MEFQDEEAARLNSGIYERKFVLCLLIYTEVSAICM